MKYEVWQHGSGDMPLMTLNADTEFDAWKILKKAGIRNRSKLIELVEIDD